MKKFFSLVLALVMALSLTTVAWGATGGAPCSDSCGDATHVAAIGTTHYTSLADAVAGAADGETVTLLSDVTESNIVIDKDITIDGAGHKITANTGNKYGLNISAADLEVTLTDLTIVAGLYAVNMRGVTDNCVITIEDCDFTGMIALNIWGTDAVINVTDSVLNCEEDDDASAYSAIVLNNDGGANCADGTVVTVTGGAINGNGSPAQSVSNWTTTGKVNISGTTSVSGDMVQVVAIIGAAGYTSVDDANAMAAAGQTIVVLPAASAQGAFTPKAGVTYKDTTGATLTPAADGKITPPAAGFVAGKYDLYDANGNLVEDDVFAEAFDAALTKTGGNVEYYELTVNGITQKYYVECAKPDAEFYLTLSGNTGAIMYLEKVPFVAYTNAKVMNNIGTACDQLNVNKKYDYYYTTDLDTDVKTYYKGVADSAATAALMVGGELVQVAPVGFGVNAHVWQIDAVNADHEVTDISCKLCKATAKVYESKLAAPKGAWNDPVYGWIALVAPTAPSTPSTDKVTSAETFDAGIAMYVGMSVMAAAGSAVVIGKKRED